MSDTELIDLWSQWTFNHAFEMQVYKAVESKKIYVPTYLSIGSEHIPVCLYQVFPDANIFAQHRAHSYFLSYGGSPERLRDELLGRHSGCTGGRGGSASIHDQSIKLWGHSGLMGDQVPIAAGFALAKKEMTVAVMGDASAEEDYVLATFGYAKTKQIPILFVCEDNDLSILTDVATRRSWSLSDVAGSFGLESREISDDPLEILAVLGELRMKLPALVNIHVARGVWHAGAGSDGPPEWNRKALFYEECAKRGLRNRLDEVEALQLQRAELLWKEV
jgi:pyruvate dehydrogenase E1 component alpha subunit